MSNDKRASPEQVEQAGRRRRLRQKDRLLVGALGLCRYVTIRQVIELGVGAKTGKATGCRLRGLAGDGLLDVRLRPLAILRIKQRR